MNIFQNIWVALTSENIVLVDVFVCIFIFIEAYISMLLFTTILNIKSEKKQKLLYVFLFSVFSILSRLFIPEPFNTFINLFAAPVLAILIFKVSILIGILTEILPFIVFVLLGSVLTSVYSSIFHLSADIISVVPIYRISFLFLSYLFAYVIYLILKKFNINISLLNKMKGRNNTRLLINFIIGICAIFIQSYIVAVYSKYFSLPVATLNVFVLFLYFVFSFYSLIRTNKLEITTQNLEEAKLYNKTLTILHDSIRGFKHDFNNIVQAIGGYVATENMDGLKKYYSELLDDCHKVNNLSVLSPDVINNPAIYSILTSKYHNADELGIKINLEIFLDLNTLNMKIYEFTRVLGILLDNAIEACSTCDEKIVNIVFRKDSNRQLIIIENTYLNKEVDTEKIFEKGFTSKNSDKKSHGLGLWEVRQILKKNNNLNLFTSKDDKFFKQQLEIYIK